MEKNSLRKDNTDFRQLKKVGLELESGRLLDESHTEQ